MSMTLLACLIAYVLGSIPNGLWLGKALWHTDLREHGSHNIGATNAWRTLGKGPGFLIFLLDFLKGFLSVYIASALVGTPLSMVLAAIFAIVGHSASLFMGFKGGKGVATGLGVLSMLMPQVTGIVFLIWLVIVKLTGYVSDAGFCLPCAYGVHRLWRGCCCADCGETQGEHWQAAQWHRIQDQGGSSLRFS